MTFDQFMLKWWRAEEMLAWKAGNQDVNNQITARHLAAEVTMENRARLEQPSVEDLDEKEDWYG